MQSPPILPPPPKKNLERALERQSYEMRNYFKSGKDKGCCLFEIFPALVWEIILIFNCCTCKTFGHNL